MATLRAISGPRSGPFARYANSPVQATPPSNRSQPGCRAPVVQSIRNRIPFNRLPIETPGKTPLHIWSRLGINAVPLKQLKLIRLHCKLTPVRLNGKGRSHRVQLVRPRLWTWAQAAGIHFLRPIQLLRWPAQAHLFFIETSFFYKGRAHEIPAVASRPLISPLEAIAWLLRLRSPLTPTAHRAHAPSQQLVL